MCPVSLIQNNIVCELPGTCYYVNIVEIDYYKNTISVIIFLAEISNLS